MRNILIFLLFSMLFTSCSDKSTNNSNSNPIEEKKGKITWLGTLRGSYSIANGVSNDGSIVVGSSSNSNGTTKPFIWKNEDGMKDLIPDINNSTNALGVSGDGKVVILDMMTSTATISKLWKAYRWTKDRGVEDLGTLGGKESTPTAISNDGKVIVGYSYTNNGGMRAFRWTEQEGMQSITGITKLSRAFGVSDDGSVIIGGTHNNKNKMVAFHWTSQQGLKEIGTIGGDESEALGISGNGEVVVGWSKKSDNYGYVAISWNNLNGFRDLTQGVSIDDKAYDVSRDGSVIIGHYAGMPFIWTNQSGLQELNKVYSHLLKDGSRLSSANAISSDGRFIVGRGFNSITKRDEAYLLDMLSE